MDMKFYGQFDPPVDKFIYERYFFRMRGVGVAIECGAFDGQLESSCKFFEETLGWDLINIEPSPPIFEHLVKNRPASKNLNMALSNMEGVANFKHVLHPQIGEKFGNGSLGHLSEHRQLLDDMGCSYKDYEVQTVRYAELIERLGVYRLDLMVLDVEGHELSVIEGMKGAKVLPRVLCVEHGHLGVRRLREAMRELPYVLDAVSHVNSYYVYSSDMNVLKRKWYGIKSWALGAS